MRAGHDAARQRGHGTGSTNPLTRFAVIALATTLTVAACGTGPSGSSSGNSSASTGSSWDRIPQIVAQVEPSVVTIARSGGEGSGVVWSDDGTIVTNNHVVEGVQQVFVVFADGERSPGTVLATDPRSDLAVVRAERKGLPAAKFATAVPPVGSLAIAIGNPLGFENSASAGIVSGQHRAVPGAAQEAPALVDLIQTDAPISPGNSGGALVGADSQIIGVNVAYIPPSAGSVSIGFAIPAPTVTDVVKQLIDNGKVVHSYLGIVPAPITPEIVEQFDLKASEGALVVEVSDGSPAAAAGVQPGDVVTAIGDANVQTVEDMLTALRRHKPGEQVQVKVNRGGQETSLQVTLGEFPG